MIEGSFIDSLLDKQNPDIARTTERVYREQQMPHASPKTELGAMARIYCTMIMSYVRIILRYDRGQCPFVYVGSELEMRHSFPLSDGRRVRFRGFIDRIDTQEGVLRIVDYKTGSVTLGLTNWEDLYTDPSKSLGAIRQTLLYSELVLSGREQGGDYLSRHLAGKEIRPLVYELKKLSGEEGKYNPEVQLGSRHSKVSLGDYRQHRDDFLAQLQPVLEEIFCSSTPFRQTAHTDSCKYCPFAISCGRG